MQIIVVTAKIQISLRVLSVESQASFLYYVRSGCKHSAPLSFARFNSSKKPLDLRTVAPVHTDNFWIMRNQQSEFGHTGRMVWIGLGCTCTREMTLIARANGED